MRLSVSGMRKVRGGVVAWLRRGDIILPEPRTNNPFPLLLALCLLPCNSFLLSLSTPSCTLASIMGMKRDDIASIAHLARIGLSDEELERAEKDLEGILRYVDRLQKVETSGVPEASASVAKAGTFRADEAHACSEAERDLILKNFPARDGALLRAPAVFERPKR